MFNKQYVRRRRSGKLKQTAIMDFFNPVQSEDDLAREDFYAQWEEFKKPTSAPKPMPTVENVRKRLGRQRRSLYQDLLAEAEEQGVHYEISSNTNMNTRTIEARIRGLYEIVYDN